MPMRVLVAGGAGYIGAHVVRSLAERGHVPVVLDNLSTGHATAVAGAPLVVADVADGGAVAAAVREHRVQAAVHLAARSLVPESMARPDVYYRQNLAGGLAFLDALRGAGINAFVLSSTAAVYGNPAQVPIPEDHPTAPLSPYGDTKLALERALHWHGAALGLRWAALRYFNAAGAHPDGSLGEDHDPETHLVPRLLQAARAGAGVEVFGTDYPTPDGTCIRDYVHVWDLALAHVAALEALAAGWAGGPCNLGTGRGHSVLEVVAGARRVTGQPLPVTARPRRAGDPPVLVAAADRARRELDWAPRHSDLDTILATAWRWHRRPAGD